MEDIEYSIQLHVHMFLFVSLHQNILLLCFNIELCSCGSRHKLLFELIAHSTVLSNIFVALICLCVNRQSTVHHVSVPSSDWVARFATSHYNEWGASIGQLARPLQLGSISTWNRRARVTQAGGDACGHANDSLCNSLQTPLNICSERWRHPCTTSF